MSTNICGLTLLMLLCLSWLAWTWRQRRPPQRVARTVQMQQLLKPRAPDDCAACCSSGLLQKDLLRRTH